jgi:hypothetical protein
VRIELKRRRHGRDRRSIRLVRVPLADALTKLAA